MTNLKEYYERHHGKVSDKWQRYLSEYEDLLAPHREHVERLLEIGVQNGGSLEIWAEFFPNVQKIVGCDINPSCEKLSYTDPRISVVVGDAIEKESYRKVTSICDAFDVVIDDGSHKSGEIIKSFASYFPILADNGFFIAEDLHCSYWDAFEGGLHHPYSSIAFFKKLADIVNYEHWGVEKAAEDILDAFSREYGVNFDGVDFGSIASIYFTNSICVIRKKNPVFNCLGRRVVSGTEETVVAGHLAARGKMLEVPCQQGNAWSARSVSLEESAVRLEQDVTVLREREEEARHQAQVLESVVLAKEADIASMHKTIEAMKASTSWRLSAPLRITKNISVQVAGSAALIPKAIRIGGGILPVGAKALRLFRTEGLRGLRRGVRSVRENGVALPSSGSGSFHRNDYSEWIRRYDTMDDEARTALRQRLNTFDRLPLISVVMPTFNANPEWLRKAIESVQNQIYPNWEICIADDASTDPAVRALLETFAEEDSRIKVVFREKNGHICAASNSALQLAVGEWVALMDHDDLLAETALYYVADAILANPGVQLIYSDEDKIDESGVRASPYFKCDWNPDLFYSHNMLSHLGVYRKSLIDEVGGFREGYEGSQDYDLALRCIENLDRRSIYHIPRVLYHWRIHSESTAGGIEAKPYAIEAGRRAINEHFTRCGVAAYVEPLGYGYRARYKLPGDMPLVTLVMPSKNKFELVKRCIDSIVAKTSYPNYEIIVVDNGSDDPRVIEYFESLSACRQIKVLREDIPFNYSRLNNIGVSAASGEIVGLVNNDLEIITPDWLLEMVGLALAPGVGAVGAKLLYPDGRIQHAGIVLGIGGVAAHAHKYIPIDNFGYFGRAALISSFSAVTGACLVVQKSLYVQVGGLNETDLAVAYNDVDFCLKLAEAGYRNVFTPYAQLFHHESATRGAEDTPEKKIRLKKEADYMYSRWGEFIRRDPAYSSNLTLEAEDFSYAWPPRAELS